MRRSLALLVAAFLSVSALITVVVATSTPATAAGTLKGKLASSADPGLVLAGMTVSMRFVTDTGPGAVVDTDTTDSGGRFELDAGPTPEDEYYVEVATTGQYHGGFVGEGWVQPSAATPDLRADAAIGKILVIPAFIPGMLVNSRTGRPVRRQGGRPQRQRRQRIRGRASPPRPDVFEITCFECEDDCYILKINGAAQGLRDRLPCLQPSRVVPTFGAACASPIGKIGKVLLDKL